MTVECLVYDEEGLIEYDDVAQARVAEGTTWVRVRRAGRDELDAVAEVFDIHPLAIEDVTNTVRPKTEEFPTYTFTLVKTAELARGETTFEEEIREETIGLFVGPDWLVSMAPGPDDPVDRIWSAVRREDRRLFRRGPDFTAYRIVDVVVDEYFELLDRIEDQIEEIEEAVLTSTEIETVEAINSVRRDLLSFRRLSWPMREAVGSLSRGDSEHVEEATEKYFRDVYDHLVQAVELTEIYRDLAAGARDIYLNTVSQSTNEVMKVLTVVATIFLPLTFVVGVYGMNFQGGPLNMPELGWEFGYPAVMIGMALVAAILLWYFWEQEYL